MVLIETDSWLGQVVDKLNKSEQRLAERGTYLTPLEANIRDVATRARRYLRVQYDASMPVSLLPPPSPARIENGVGEGISQFAYAGALSPDFPAAGHILA